MFLLGEFLSVFSSCLGTTSPYKTSDNFPELRARLAEVQIFVLFSHLSGFLNFLTTNSPIGTFESFTEQDFVEIQVSLFSPCSTDNMFVTPQCQLVIFQPEASQHVSFGFNTKVSSISRHLGKKLFRLNYSWYWETKHP